MANIEKALVPFTMLMISFNLIILFMSGLPSNTAGTQTYNFGLPASFETNTIGYVENLEDDMNALANQGTGVKGSTESRTDIDLLGQILGGIGLLATAPSIIINLVNYILLALFGFWFWIDYFFAPLVAGFAGFSAISFLIKGIFLLIQLLGLVYLFMMIYSGFRK